MSHNQNATHAILRELFKYSNICFANHLGSTSFSRTPDRDFRYFYPREKILSHIPVQAHGKDKKKRTAARRPHAGRTSICDVIVMLK